jgi:hypothetical protein
MRQEEVFQYTGLTVGVRVMGMEYGVIQWEGPRLSLATRIQVGVCVKCGAI